MQWEDERWVKLYTSETPDWASIDWEARAVFNELLKKVTRAGVMPLGKTKLRGVAALLRMPAAVVERSVPALVEDGCVVVTDSHIVIRNFIQAQEAKTSDAMRKRADRERARDMASVNENPELAMLVNAPPIALDKTSANGQSVQPADETSENGPVSDKTSGFVHFGHEQKRREEKRVEENRSQISNTAPQSDAGCDGLGEQPPASAPSEPDDDPDDTGPDSDNVAPSPAGKQPRGTRIPEDWNPGKATHEWCAAEGVRDPFCIRDEFVDFWRDVPGAKGLKVRWDGTYRNRLRELIKRGDIDVIPKELRAHAARKTAPQPSLFDAPKALATEQEKAAAHAEYVATVKASKRPDPMELLADDLGLAEPA